MCESLYLVLYYHLVNQCRQRKQHCRLPPPAKCSRLMRKLSQLHSFCNLHSFGFCNFPVLHLHSVKQTVATPRLHGLMCWHETTRLPVCLPASRSVPAGRLPEARWPRPSGRPPGRVHPGRPQCEAEGVGAPPGGCDGHPEELPVPVRRRSADQGALSLLGLSSGFVARLLHSFIFSCKTKKQNKTK